MERKQFTFYRSFYESIQKLQTNKEKLQAYEMICSFGLNKTEPELDSQKPCAAMVFTVCRPILETAHKRAEQAQLHNNVKQL